MGRRSLCGPRCGLLAHVELQETLLLSTHTATFARKYPKTWRGGGGGPPVQKLRGGGESNRLETAGRGGGVNRFEDSRERVVAEGSWAVVAPEEQSPAVGCGPGLVLRIEGLGYGVRGFGFRV